MKVTVHERWRSARDYENVKAINKKEFHIFITTEDGNIHIHELDDVVRIEVSV